LDARHPHGRRTPPPAAGGRRPPGRAVRVAATPGRELRHRRDPRQGRGPRLPLGSPGQGAGRMAALPRRRHPRPPHQPRRRPGDRAPGDLVTIATGTALTIPPHVPGDPWYSEERLALRETTARFAEREILPHLDEWEAAGAIPRELHRKAGELGLLGVSFPEEVGGGGGDAIDSLVVCEALHEAGVSGGVFASLFTCGIATPHLAQSGRPDQIERWVKPTLAGEMIGSLAITEPGGGSDVGHLTTTARRDGDRK